MELFESVVRVTWDPDGAAVVLVDYGTPMWEPVRLDGQQLLDVSPLVRAAGSAVIPRGNETHILTFMKAAETAGVREAIAGQIGAQRSAPRGRADVLLQVGNHGGWRLRGAAVESWPGGQAIEHIAAIGLRIMGGDLVVDPGTPTPGGTWGEINLQWQNIA